MMPNQLRETTMSPKTRRLIRVDLPPRTEEGAEDTEKTRTIVSELMGKKPEFRFKFITEHAQFIKDLFVKKIYRVIPIYFFSALLTTCLVCTIYQSKDIQKRNINELF